MTKRLIVLFLLTNIMSATTMAQLQIQNLTEAEQLGSVAGLAQACGSNKLEDFEVIASRILANKAPTEESEYASMKEYVMAKYRVSRSHNRDPQMTCTEILDHIDKLPIFNSVVYADGTVKMFDGSWLKPKRPIKGSKNKNASKSTQSAVHSR